MNDWQCSRMYVAQAEIGKSNHFANMAEVKDFVDEVIDSEWWDGRFGFVRVELRDGRGCKHANVKGFILEFINSNVLMFYVISLPRWSRTPETILHELAHVATDTKYGFDVPAHGREFCEVYLNLVSEWIGEKTADRLQRSFEYYNVEWEESDV